jgi:hypothetical protein
VAAVLTLPPALSTAATAARDRHACQRTNVHGLDRDGPVGCGDAGGDGISVVGGEIGRPPRRVGRAHLRSHAGCRATASSGAGHDRLTDL